MTLTQAPPRDAKAVHGVRSRPTFRGWSESVPGPALLVLLLIAAFMLLVNPAFVSPGNLLAIAQQASVPMVLAVGLTFVILMGGIDLSLEGVMAAGSLTLALLVANDRNANDLGLLAIPVAVAVGAAVGAVGGISVGFLKVPSFIVTIGTWQIGLGIAQLLFDDGPPQVEDPAFRSFFVDDLLGVPGMVWIAIAVVGTGLAVQHLTRFGRYAFVIGANEDIAAQTGVQVRRYRAVAFVVAGATAGLAAVLATGRVGVGDVTIGSGLLFTTIAGVVIGGTFLTGGRGGVLHSVVGVLVIVSIANAMVLAGVSSYVQQAVQGGVVVIAAVVTMWRLRTRMRVVK
jgi:ribose transport system permease protein